MRQALEQDLLTRRHRLAQLAVGLEALSPLEVLARGYTVTFQADGKTLLRKIRDVKTGDVIHTRLGSGLISSRVL